MPGPTTGKNGIVKIGSTAIAELSSWTISQTAEPIEHSVIGTVDRKYMTGLKGWTVSMEGFYSMDDSAQQALVFDTELALELFPGGENTGEADYSGNCYLTSYEEAGPFDGMVTFTAEVQGTGALTKSTVP